MIRRQPFTIPATAIVRLLMAASIGPHFQSPSPFPIAWAEEPIATPRAIGSLIFKHLADKFRRHIAEYARYDDDSNGGW